MDQVLTDTQIDARLIKSRQGLWAWTHEARLPWADKPMIRSLLETEIGILKHLRDSGPERKRGKIDALIGQFQALIASLT